MILMASGQTTRLRLAQHYLDKLRRANAAIRRRSGNRHDWLMMIREDWEQIREGQAWSASGDDIDVERIRLCSNFTLATSDILRVQLTPSEQLVWIQQALDAARKLGDREAERTLLYQLVMLNLTLEVVDEVDQQARQLMDFAQAAHDNLSLGRSWYLLGTAAFMRGAFDTAEESLVTSLRLLEGCNAVEEVPIVWRGLARTAQFRGNYQHAYTNYRHYLDSAETAGNEQAILDAHVAISGVLLALRDYQLAADYAQRAVVMARTFGMSRIFPPALLSLAHAEKWLGNYESACSHYQEAIVAARSFCPPSTVSNGLYGLGQAKYLQGDSTSALAYLEEASVIAHEAQLPLRICEISHDIVLVHIARGELDVARLCLEEAIITSRQLGTPHFMAKSLAAAVMLWVSRQQHEQAAVWAGLLTNYMHNLHPTLFKKAVYQQLEESLGTPRYQQALQQGKLLELDSALSEILNALGSNR